MNTPRLPKDKLFELELKIAQRADQLARLYGTDPEQVLEHWRQAEREVWRSPADRHVRIASTARHALSA